MTDSGHALVRPVARPNGWWGMLLLIGTEASLFGCLIASYFYVRFRSVEWPQGGLPEPKVVLPLVFTALLVLSSVPMALAARAARRGAVGPARLGLAAAFLLGAAFCAFELHQLLSDAEAFRPQRNAYASLYFTLGGAHLAHALAGLLLNAFLLVRLSRGLTGYRSTGVQTAALYWYFVNVLAVAVVATTLSPAL